jgi:fatty-acyl-CoA synthase
MDLATLCPLTVPDALARTVALAPDVEAIVASDGRATLGELGAQVAEVRRALLTAGIGKGDRVGICLGNSRGWVVLFLALGSIGAVQGKRVFAPD